MVLGSTVVPTLSIIGLARIADLFSTTEATYRSCGAGLSIVEDVRRNLYCRRALEEDKNTDNHLLQYVSLVFRGLSGSTTDPNC